MAAINTDNIRRAESLQKAQELASQQFGGQLPKEIQAAQSPAEVADGIEKLSGPAKGGAAGGAGKVGGCSACGCQNGQCSCGGKCKSCADKGGGCVNGNCGCPAPGAAAPAGAEQPQQQPAGDAAPVSAPQETAVAAA